MIIKRLWADNILKYRKLQLSDLPTRGRIGVCGANESGKTAIGETICFALFGRTFSLTGDELQKAIRWGEFRGSVLLEFSGRDGRDYVVVREIDNEGGHTVHLTEKCQRRPIAQGVDAVADMIGEIIGFGYDRFVNSFYLAQREIQVFHDRSATVKSLIGVDSLEAMVSDLEEDQSSTNAAIADVATECADARVQLDGTGLDRLKLGRLEARREQKLQTVARTEAEVAQLETQQQTVGKVAAAFVDATRKFAETTPNASYTQWRKGEETVSATLVAATAAAQAPGCGGQLGGLAGAGATLKSFETGLADYRTVCTHADRHRTRLRHLLDLEEGDDAGEAEQDTATDTDSAPTRFAKRRARLLELTDRLTHRRGTLLLFGVLLFLLAGAGWAVWGVYVAAPETLIAQWIQTNVNLSEAVLRTSLLAAAAAVTGAALLLFGFHLRTTQRIRALRRRVDQVDAEAEQARKEISVIDELDSAAVPEAVAALRDVSDDLLRSSVVAFSAGDGAILIQPQALQQKLAQLRRHSTEAEDSLSNTQERLRGRAAELSDEIGKLRGEIKELDGEIETQRRLWQQVETLERVITGLEAKKADLVRRVEMLKLARQLVEGTRRRIYAKFHPELRRFVGKVLPRLTADRYQHLQIDEDFNIRVFSNEKSDFVGLEEISNGTHRQLMLSIRLALSQALICSTTRSPQFIFLDEPFAFFDKQRMKWAIEVLGKFSPQVSQVWIVAQDFDDPSAFDTYIRCEVNEESLVIAGESQRTSAVNGGSTD